MAEDLSEAEIASLLAQPKVMLGQLDWQERPSNSAFLCATGPLLNPNDGATITGLTVELQYRRGSLAPEDCNYNFAVFLFRGGQKRRVYVLEVYPRDRQSHSGSEGTFFGPHEHFGMRAAEVGDEGDSLGCPDHEAWFRVFLRRANIQFGGRYLPPERQGRLPYVM